MMTRSFGRRGGRLACATLIAIAATSACNSPAEPDRDDFDLDAPTWVALDKACPPDAPATSLADSLRVAPQAPDRFRSPDDQNAEIARQVPGGWGGLWAEDGQPVISLVDPSQREKAVAKLTALGVGGGRFDLARARVVKGRWDFAQLYDWYNYLNPHVWGAGNVISSDINEKHNRIEYGVLDESTRDRISERLAGLDIPCFLVAVGITSPVVPTTR